MYSLYPGCANLTSNFSGFHSSFLTTVISVIVRVSKNFFMYSNLYVYDLHSNFCCLAVVDYISSDMQLNIDFVWLPRCVNRVLISIILQTQLCRCCILLLFSTTACFSCSLQPSSGRKSIHKTSTRERCLLKNSRCKGMVK